VVGVNLQVQSYDGRYSFLEGNEMVWVDSDKKPSIVGTGTEDYFSGGWYFNKGEFAGPYNGLILKDDSLGRISAYRLYIMDPIPFKKQILFTIEHGHGNSEIADYSSTAYWYQLEDHPFFPTLPKAGKRVPLQQVIPNNLVEAEDLVILTDSIQGEVIDVSDLRPDWSGGKHLVFQAFNGSELTIMIKEMYDESYDIDLYFSMGPDYGDIDIYYQGKKIGAFSGYSPSLRAGGGVKLNNIIPYFGLINLKLVVSDKNRASEGYKIGLDGLDIKPKRKFIPDWYILGPFPNPRTTENQRLGLDSIFTPEIKLNINSRYSGANGKQIGWKYVETPENGYINLNRLVNPNELVVTYALTYIFSMNEKDALLMIGNDDGVKVFFNNKEVYRYLGISVAKPDQVVIPVHLRVGWNKLLMKVENNLGGYAFFARILDPGNTLFYSAKQTDPPQSWVRQYYEEY